MSCCPAAGLQKREEEPEGKYDHGEAKEAHLAAVTVNPVSAGGWTFPAEEFLEKMQNAVAVPVLDVMTMEAER